MISTEKSPVSKKKSFKYYSILLVSLIFVLNYIIVALGIDGMNVLMPGMIQKFGWTPGQIMTKVSLGGMLSVVTGYFCSTLIAKKGNKPVLVVSILLAAGVFLALPFVKTIGQFTVIMIVLGAFAMPAILVSSFSLVCNWFIRKRGIIFGIVTIAAPVSSATFTPIGTKILMATSFESFYIGWGVVLMLIAIFAWFTTFERPEDYGLYPDGDEYSEKELEEINELSSAESKWTVKKVFSVKETWIIIFGWGLIYLMMTGIMSQFIPTLTTAGVSLDRALLMMSIAAVIGMPLSYGWGWLDDKIGTPKTCVVFSFAYIIASLCLLLGRADNMIPFYIAMIMIAATTGGMPNLVPSIQGYVFGRREFVHVNKYINIGHNLFRSIGIAYMAVIFDIFGSYKPVFISFIFMSLIVFGLFISIKKTYDPERIELQKLGKAK